MSKFNPRNNIFTNWNKTCYIASRLEPIIDDYGNEIAQYDEPIKYKFNYQPVTNKNDANLEAYGITSTGVIRAIIDNEYLGQIKEYDLAYLYESTPEDETSNGANANYRVITFIPQNTRILVYFEKLVKKQGGSL